MKVSKKAIADAWNARRVLLIPYLGPSLAKRRRALDIALQTVMTNILNCSPLQEKIFFYPNDLFPPSQKPAEAAAPSGKVHKKNTEKKAVAPPEAKPAIPDYDSWQVNRAAYAAGASYVQGKELTLSDSSFKGLQSQDTAARIWAACQGHRTGFIIRIGLREERNNLPQAPTFYFVPSH